MVDSIIRRTWSVNVSQRDGLICARAARGPGGPARPRLQIYACTRHVGPILETEIDMMRELQLTLRRFVQDFQNLSESCPPEMIAAEPRVT